MRNAQELRSELMNRLKKAAENRAPVEPTDRTTEVIPGTRYRDERGRMVLVISASQLRVKYYREGFSDVYEMGRYQFDLKFKKVQE